MENTQKKTKIIKQTKLSKFFVKKEEKNQCKSQSSRDESPVREKNLKKSNH